MSITTTAQMRLPILKFMADNKEHYINKVFDYLDREFQFSEEEKSQCYRRTGEPILKNRMRFALANLKQAELLESTERGYYKITEKGLNALRENPSIFVFESNREFHDKFVMPDSRFFFPQKQDKGKTNYKQNLNDDEDSSQTPLELIEENYRTTMNDIKLFKLNHNSLEELESNTFSFERDLQNLIEANMKTILGITFLQSEYTTDREHEGHIDTLGIDENYRPVIIEYKHLVNDIAIAQVLSYLDWLTNPHPNFELMVLRKLGNEYADKIEWSPRLLCIASDFTEYDKNAAVKQMNRNIEFIRYRKYGDNILLLEKIVSPTPTSNKDLKHPQKIRETRYKTHSESLTQLSGDMKTLYFSVVNYIKNLGDDVQEKELKQYVSFKISKCFVSIVIRPTKGLDLYLRLNPDQFDLSSNLIRDVRNIGHHGTGDLKATISNIEQFEQVKHLIIKSYEAS